MTNTPVSQKPWVGFADYVGPGGLVIMSTIVLLLWAGTTIFLLNNVLCCRELSADEQPRITDELLFVNTATGGLVSALVIALVTSSGLGHNPASQFRMIRVEAEAEFKAADDEGAKQDAKKKAARSNTLYVAYTVLLITYFAVWIILGLLALVIGVIFFPEANGTLNSFGTGWIGALIGAGYAGFGLRSQATGT